MLARTFYAAQAFIILSLFAITNSASAQSYHHPIRHIRMESISADSTESPRLQLNIQQQDKESLKFRITILNPQGRPMSISIVRNNDVLFSEYATGDQYLNLFSFAELEDGNHKVTVFNGKERVTKNIHLQTATTVDRQVSIN